MSINPLYAWALVVTVAVAVVALVLNAQIAFFLAFFIVMGVWAWQWPTMAFWLLIIVAPLLPMFKITQTIGTVTLLKDVLIFVLFTKLFLLPLVQKKLPYRRNVLVAPLILLAGWLFIGLVQADSVVLGVLRARDSFMYVLLFLAVLYLPDRQAGLPRGERFYREALGWFLVSALIVGALGWYQFFVTPDSTVLRFDPARQIWIPRLSSTLAHPSVFGQYLILVSTVAVAGLLGQWRRRLWQWLLLLVAAVPLIYYTYSRAVWLGFLVALAAVGVALCWQWLRSATRLRISWKPVVGVVLLLVVGSVLVLQFSSAGVFLRSALDPTYASNAVRLDFLARLISPITPRQALFGAGLGDVVAQNFRSADVDTFDIASGASRTVQLAKDATLVDNQYLKTFVELGLAGLLIYVWIYWRVAKYSWALVNLPDRQAGTYSSAIQKTIGFLSIGFLAAFVVQAFFIDIWDIFPTNMAFWIIAALVSREQVPPAPKTPA